MYTLTEALARERLCDQLEQAAARRLAREVSTAQRWQRLAAFCARRAARSQRELSEHADAEYQLVG